MRWWCNQKCHLRIFSLFELKIIKYGVVFPPFCFHICIPCFFRMERDMICCWWNLSKCYKMLKIWLTKVNAPNWLSTYVTLAKRGGGETNTASCLHASLFFSSNLSHLMNVNTHQVTLHIEYGFFRSISFRIQLIISFFIFFSSYVFFFWKKCFHYPCEIRRNKDTHQLHPVCNKPLFS